MKKGLVCIVHEPLFLSYLGGPNLKNMTRLNLPVSLASVAFVLAAALTSCGTPSPSGDAQVKGSAEQADALVHAEWTKNATIYEVNLRQHTPEGTIEAFLPDLPRLKDLGVDILWLMPIHPIGEVNRCLLYTSPSPRD